MGLEFSFDDAHEFAAVLATAPSIVEREMVNAANRVALQGEAWAKAAAPVKAGHLRRSIAATPAVYAGGVVTATFGTATPYARHVEDGRGPVVAKKKALRFSIGGKVLFRKRVGPAAAKPFIRPTRERLAPLVPREFEAALQRVVARIRQAMG